MTSSVSQCAVRMACLFGLAAACADGSMTAPTTGTLARDLDASIERPARPPLSDAGAGADAAPEANKPDAPVMLCNLAPPTVVMSSPAGELTGGYASSCINCILNDQGDGMGVCADGPTGTNGSALIHPGDGVSFSMPDGTLMAGTRCDPACPPQIMVSPMSCPYTTLTVLGIQEDVPLSIDLAPGHYLLTFSSHFEAGRKSGSMGAGFGLIVDPDAERKVLHEPTNGDFPEDCAASGEDAG